MPGTPRREAGGHAREKAVQDPGLKDYVRFASSFLPSFLPPSLSFLPDVFVRVLCYEYCMTCCV
ncbi:hypothetical protein QBC45DRAFT_414708 [Copromyces sp. CBS 386.78]|nr:hypothetical protein QBC45DRAFT_414708 [Copromyces sp. CBS 386.78]